MIKELLLNKEVAGEIVKNIGLGVFINGLYGISDGSIEFFQFNRYGSRNNRYDYWNSAGKELKC